MKFYPAIDPKESKASPPRFSIVAEPGFIGMSAIESKSTDVLKLRLSTKTFRFIRITHGSAIPNEINKRPTDFRAVINNLPPVTLNDVVDSKGKVIVPEKIM
mgnify:CR=1 FL=1